MAFSQSVKKSQVPVSCYLCETDRPIKWKCIDCSLLMCNNCKEKVHSKFKNAYDHKIIDIKEVGLHAEELDFKNIKCKEHAEYNCCLFCTTCDDVVCPSCVSKVHMKHDLIEIKEGYEMKLDILKKGQSNIQKEKSYMADQMDQINKRTSAEKSKLTKVSQDILTHEISVKAAVDNYFEKVRNELDYAHKTAMMPVDAGHNTVSVSIKLADDKISEVQDLIQITDATKFFLEIKLIEKSMTVQTPQIKSNYGSISTPIFIPGEITQYNVGILQSDQTVPIEPIVMLNINKQYQTQLRKIINISQSIDNSLCISSGSDGVIQKLKSDGNKLKVIYNFNIQIRGITLLSSDDFLLSIEGNFILQQLNMTTGKITPTTYNLFPFSPTAIYTANGSDIIVGCSAGDLTKIAVIVMNEKGDHERVYEHDHNNQPIFMYPVSIASTFNANIHVADYRSSQGRGRVVVLGQGVDTPVINTYSGHTYVNKNMPFRPVRIVTTPRDNVIVVDIDTFYLHILSNAGQLITFYNTLDIGISAPYSLAFTTTGELLIGCTSPQGSTTKNAKIYEVTISGC